MQRASRPAHPPRHAAWTGAVEPIDPVLEALEAAERRIQETAAAYFAASGPSLERAREAYYEALAAHADAEARYALAAWPRGAVEPTERRNVGDI